MVFNAPTTTDYRQADEYASAKRKLRMYAKGLCTKPHIWSWVNVEIRLNTSLNNTEYESANNNLDVRLIGTKKFCEQIHCNMTYPRGKTCAPTTKPHIFKSGNSDVVACHAPCFGLFGKNKNEDGEYISPNPAYYSDNQKCCLLQLQPIMTQATDDYTRTNNHPTKRVDTIGTGFDLDDRPFIDKLGNETQHYKLNKYYCDDFMYKLSTDNKQCTSSVTEDVVSFVVSDNAYKFGQYSMRAFSQGVFLEDVQKVQLPPIVKPPPSTHEQWINTVNKDAFIFNPNLKLSELGIKPGCMHLIFTTEYGWPGKLVEPLMIYRNPSVLDTFYDEHKWTKKPTREEQSNYTVIRVDYAALNEKLLPQFRYDENGKRLHDEFDLLETYNLLKKSPQELDDTNNETDKKSKEEFNRTKNRIEQMYKSLLASGPDIIKDVVLSALVDKVCKKLVYVMKRYSEKLGKHATRTTMRLGERSLYRIASQRFLLQSSKAAAKLLKIMASGLSVALVIFEILGLIDLFLFAAGIDWWNHKQLMDQTTIDNLYSMAEFEIKRNLFGYETIEYSPAYFDMMENIIKNRNLPKDSIFEDEKYNMIEDLDILLPNSILPPVSYAISSNDVALLEEDYFMLEGEYLFRLKKNSTGMKINWNEEESFDLNAFDTFIDTFKIPHTTENYKIYIKTALRRNKILSIGLMFNLILILLILFTKNIILVFISIFLSSILFLILFSKFA